MNSFVRWGLVGAFLVGCGGADHEENSPGPVSSDDQTVYEALPATRSELGITTWAVSSDDNGNITGRDAANEVVLRLGHFVKPTDAEHSLERFELRRGDDIAGMTMAVTTREDAVVDVSMAENTFYGKSEYARLFELLTLDLAANKRVEAHSPNQVSGGSLATNDFRGGSLQPLDEPCPTFVKYECDPKFVNDGKGAGLTVVEISKCIVCPSEGRAVRCDPTCVRSADDNHGYKQKKIWCKETFRSGGPNSCSIYESGE